MLSSIIYTPTSSTMSFPEDIYVLDQNQYSQAADLSTIKCPSLDLIEIGSWAPSSITSGDPENWGRASDSRPVPPIPNDEPRQSGRKSTSRHRIRYIDREYGPLTTEALHHPQRDEVRQHNVRLLDRYVDPGALAPVQEKLFVDSMKSCGKRSIKWSKVSRSSGSRSERRKQDHHR